jgi:hypothetical protein
MDELPRRLGAALLVVIGCAAAPAEEAYGPDGKPVSGALAVDAKGRLRFTPTGRTEALPSAAISHVRFSTAEPTPLRSASLFQFVLYDGQRLTGKLLALDEKNLTLRTAWSEKLNLPRSALASVAHLPGWRTVFEDDFADGAKAWKRTGEPAFGENEERLVLKEPGQALTYELSAPLETGRVGVNFRVKEKTAGALWHFDAAFQTKTGRRPLSITLAGGGDTYEVETPGVEGTSMRVARTPGWHRLTIQFTARSLRVLCDDAVLWYCLDQGPSGRLTQVRLECLVGDKKAAATGEVAFAEFGVSRVVDEAPRPEGDAGQDEVWLANGDQLFGRIPKADRRGVIMEGRFGKRFIPWSEANGVFLKRDAPPPQTTDGAHVRLYLWPAEGAEPDLLEGVVTALDERRLTLRHNRLGEVTIDRAHLRRLEPLFFGGRIELDNGIHHLGDATRTAPGFQPPRPEGTSWRGAFRLDAVPGEARLLVHVVRLAGEKDGVGETLRAGGLRTEVVVNGKSVDYLNRQVDRALPEPRRLVVPLPRTALRAGENTIELRQTPERGTGRYPHCGVFRLALELPRDE